MIESTRYAKAKGVTQGEAENLEKSRRLINFYLLFEFKKRNIL